MKSNLIKNYEVCVLLLAVGNSAMKWTQLRRVLSGLNTFQGSEKPIYF